MKRISYLLLTAVLFVGIAGCGGDSTGPDVTEDPPQMPNIEKAEPDISFFENNNPQKAASSELNETNNYVQAKSIVMWNTILFSFGQSYGLYFTQADQEEATFNNGVWEWSYTYNFEGMSASYRTTAEELGNSVRWATYWSYNDGQGGGYDNYKIFEGTVSNDESTGDWTFNTLDTNLDSEVPFITSTWNYTSETERVINLTMYGDAIDDESASETATIDFEQNDADFSMNLNFANGETHLVNWNTDTNIGSITSNGETVCWDENFQDVSCE